MENGADIKEKNQSISWGALKEAIVSGHIDCVKYLVERGADINVKDEDGKTPEDYAAMQFCKKAAGYFQNITKKGI